MRPSGLRHLMAVTWFPSYRFARQFAPRYRPLVLKATGVKGGPALAAASRAAYTAAGFDVLLEIFIHLHTFFACVDMLNR